MAEQARDHYRPATVSVEFTRENVRADFADLTDEQWGEIVHAFAGSLDDLAEEVFNEVVEEICGRKHADTPTWREER